MVLAVAVFNWGATGLVVGNQVFVAGMVARGESGAVGGDSMYGQAKAIFGKIKHLLKRPIIVDTKNLLDSVRLRAMGFQYMGVGRG